MVNHQLRSIYRESFELLDDMIRRTQEGTGMVIDILDENTDWARLDYDPLQQWIQKGLAE